MGTKPLPRLSRFGLAGAVLLAVPVMRHALRRKHGHRSAFESDHVVDAFEKAMGVHLTSPDDRGIERILVRNPARRAAFPRVTYRESSDEDDDRFGGKFFVRVYLDGDWRDKRTRDSGLYCGPGDFGDYLVDGSAHRANVELGFYAAAAEITPRMGETWASLVSCLRRL